jgi:hypothetical protein
MTPDRLLRRLLNVLDASIETAPEFLASGPSLLWYPLRLLAALRQMLSSTTNEELWPGDSFHWVPPLTPSTSTPLLPLHTLPVLIQSHPLLPNTVSSAEPEAISTPTVVPTSAPTATSWPQATRRGGARRASVLVVRPLGISLGTARNFRLPTTPGMTTMSSRTREAPQDRIAELAEQVLNQYEGGNVTVFTLLPYSFGVPVGFQPIFSLIHYA